MIMTLYQKILIRLLNPIGRIIARIDSKKNNIIIFVCCALINAYFIAFFSNNWRGILPVSFTGTHILCSFILFILTLFSINRELNTVSCNNFLYYAFFVTGLAMFAISFIHPIGSGYRAFSLIMMLGFPAIYFVWTNRRDINTLYFLLSLATDVVGLVYYVYCIRLAFDGMLTTGTRAAANLKDANLLSMIGMVMFSSAAYIVVLKGRSMKWFGFAALSAGVGVSMVAMGVSRGSILIVAGSIFCLLWYILKISLKSNDKIKKAFCIKSIAMICSVFAFLIIGNYMIQTSIEIAGAQSEAMTVLAADTTGTADEIAVSEITKERFSTGHKDINAFSSGRIRIWKNYSHHLNMLGNDFSRADWGELTDNTVGHAHNNFFEFGYRFGVPIALCHILIELYAGIVALKYLFSRKYKDPAFFFTVIYVMMYAVESMIDIATIPFERHAPFFFYIALLTMFAETETAR